MDIAGMAAGGSIHEKDEYGKGQRPIKPLLPAVTCSSQATCFTGKWPSEHGIILTIYTGGYTGLLTPLFLLVLGIDVQKPRVTQ